MPGSDIRLGPWPDGINLLDKPDQLRDTQLSDCYNFDVDNTGVLVPRRPLRYKALDAETAHTKYLLGTVVLDGETTPRAMVARYDGATSYFRWFSSPNDPQTDASSARSGIFRTVVQYQSKIWYIPATAASVGASSPALVGNAFTAVATMPWGDDAFILKDRLFIIRKSTSELYFSKATDFTNWAAPDGGVIQVAPGDNNPITKVVVINNQIIIFKRDSTWVLSFTSSPTGDGVLRQISADQGAIDAITYNNEVYCYNARSVFKFVNGFFQDIGLQLNLPNTDTIDATSASPARINVVGKTLIFGKTPSNKIYAMNLDTGAWTEYGIESDVSISTKTISSRSAVGTAIFFGDGTTKLGYMLVSRGTIQTDLHSNGSYRTPLCKFYSKVYNFEDSEVWKRLYSVHLDIDFNSAATVAGELVVYVDDETMLPRRVQQTTDAVDLIGNIVSSRFRTLMIGYVRFASLADAESSKHAPIALRGIRAVIGAKAPVST